MGHLVEDENLHYGSLTVEMVLSVHRTTRQAWRRCGVHHVVEVEIVRGKLLVRVAVRLEVVTEPFVEAIARGSSSLELKGVLESHGRQASVHGSLCSPSYRDVGEVKSDVRR